MTFIVIEFKGGDPYFGGSADDRPLGKEGKFLTGCYVRDRDMAFFDTREDAERAARPPGPPPAGEIIGPKDPRAPWKAAP